MSLFGYFGWEVFHFVSPIFLRLFPVIHVASVFLWFRYYALVKRLNGLPHVSIPDQYPEVTIVGDSVQMTMKGWWVEGMELLGLLLSTLA